MTSICLIALPNMIATSISLPLEMLNAADDAVRVQQHRRSASVEIVGLEPGTLRAAGGMPLAIERSYRDTGQANLIILPTRWRHPLRPLPRQAEFLDWLRQNYHGGATICAIGTGSFLLAEAGLLDNRPATTHWHYFDDFETRFPRVNLMRHYLLTEADRLYCAGSVNSGADLMVHIIGVFWGAPIAQQVERQFSPEIRRPFHNHAYRVGQANLHADEAIAQSQAWLVRHFNETVAIGDLAQQAGLGERNFHRRFRQATGKTPLQYQQDLRIDNARELLRNSNLSVADVAQQVGYGDVSHFCKLFRQRHAQTPAAYRRSVRGKLFSVE